MRGFSGAALTMGFVLVAGTSQAGFPLSEVGGNWAGTAGNGFYFRATLEQEEDRARLRIWNAAGAPPQGGEAQLDVPDFALAAFATDQHLEVLDDGTGAILQVVTAYADEAGEGREVVQLRFIDNQFTVTGYAHLSRFDDDKGTRVTLSCEVDAWAGTVTEDGRTRRLPDRDFEALNASGWHYGAAFDRGWCSRRDY